MARLIDPQMRLAQRQQRMAEQQMRLQNDPGRIFLRSLAQTVPQQLVAGAVNIGRDALGYKVFGGERKQMAAEAEAFPNARLRFFQKYYPKEYERLMAPQRRAEQRRAASKEMDAILGPPTQRRVQAQQPKQPQQQAMPKDPRMEESYIPKKPVFKELGDGKFAVAMDEPALEGFGDVLPNTARTRRMMRDQGFAVGPGGKQFRIVDAREKKRIEAQYQQASAARKAYQQQGREAAKSGNQFVAPGDALPKPEAVGAEAKKVSSSFSLAPLIDAQNKRLLRTSAGASIEMPGMPVVIPSSKEVTTKMQQEGQTARAVLSAETELTKNERTNIKGMLQKSIANMYNFLPKVSAEDLAQERARLQRLVDLETDPGMRNIYESALYQLPSEELRVAASTFVGEDGNRKWGQISKSIPSSFSVGMPKLRDIQTSVDKAHRKYIQIQTDIDGGKLTPGQLADARKEQQVLRAKVASLVSRPDAKQVIILDGETGMPIGETIGFRKGAAGAGASAELEEKSFPALYAINPAKYASIVRNNPKAVTELRNLMSPPSNMSMEDAMAVLFDSSGKLRSDLRDSSGSSKTIYPVISSLDGGTVYDRATRVGLSGGELKSLEKYAAGGANIQKLNDVITEASAITVPSKDKNKIDAAIIMVEGK